MLYNPDEQNFKILVKQINPTRAPLRSNITITSTEACFEINGDATIKSTYSLERAFSNCPKITDFLCWT